MESISLEELTAQLQEAQEKKATVRLSERNVVELVNKLKELGILKIPLLHTMDGKAYLTSPHLRKEIQEALYASGGRISLSELCTSLNVDMVYIERETNVLVNQSKGFIQYIQQELISENYLNTIAHEINERLNTMGMIRIGILLLISHSKAIQGDLAIQYGLSHDLLLTTISARLGSVIHGELMKSMLYTQDYIQRSKAQIRGALRGTPSPIHLSTLLKFLQLEDSGTSNMIQKLLSELIEQGHVKGELRSNGQWIPHIHSKSQKAILLANFRQAGWISLEEIRKVGASDDAFVREHFSNELSLDSVIVTRNFAETVREEALETLENEDWCDMSVHVPTDFSIEDIRLLLSHTSFSEWKDTVVLTETCLVKTSFIEKCREHVRQVAEELAKEDFCSMKRKKQVSSSATQETKGVEERTEDDKSVEKKSKKKGKAKSRTKGTDFGKDSERGGKSSNEMASCPNTDTVAQQLLQWYREVEDVDGLVGALAEQLTNDAIEAYKQTIEETSRMTDKRRQEMKDDSLKQLEDTLNKLWMFSKGIDALEDALEDTTVTFLRKHLIRSTGTDAVDWMLRYYQLLEPGADEGIVGDLVPISPSERTKLIEHLPSDLVQPANIALQSTKQDSPAMILESVDAGMASCGVRFPKRDKKAEKQKLIDFKNALKNKLLEEERPATVLAFLLPLMLAEKKEVALNLPGRAMPAAIDLLKSCLSEEPFRILDNFHKAVVEDLKSQSMPNSTSRDPNAERSLLELLSKAKNLVRE